MSKIKITTPKGALKWAQITGAGKKDLQGRDIFSVDIEVAQAAAQELVDQIDALWESDKPKGAKDPKSVKIKDKIGNGSIGRVSGMASIYDAGVAARGVTLYLDSVQLIKLIKYAEAASFDVEEGDDVFTNDATFVAEDI